MLLLITFFYIATHTQDASVAADAGLLPRLILISLVATIALSDD